MSHPAPNKLHRFRTVAVALAAALLLPAIGARAEGAKVPAIDREIMNRAAEIAFSRELDGARAKRALDRNREQLRSAHRMAEYLIAYAPTMAPEVADWKWTIHLVTRDEPVAWCLPGGKMMLSTGLVDRTRLTPPEVGVVLAHAIAHALTGRDAAKAAARLAALNESPDPNRRILQLADILGKMITSEPHGKEEERETDAIALELMARAGLDPEPTVDAWRKIVRAGGATPPGFLFLHPTWPGRLDEIEAMMPAALPLYEQARAEQAAKPRPPTVRMR